MALENGKIYIQKKELFETKEERKQKRTMYLRTGQSI